MKAAEHALQKQIADALRIELGPPGRVSPKRVTWFSIDHASYAGDAPGARIGRGIIKGIPDVLVLYDAGAFFIEIKTESPDSVLSEGQKNALVTIASVGCPPAVVVDVEGVLAALDKWGIPRRRAVRLPLKAA